MDQEGQLEIFLFHVSALSPVRAPGHNAEHLQNDLFCDECDVKLHLDLNTSSALSVL